MELIRMRQLNQECFDVHKTMSCGQCFRWSEEGNVYVGVVGMSLLTLDVRTHNLGIYGADLDDAVLDHYFDLNTDYETRLEEISRVDEHLENAVAYGRGMRLLNQDPFETLISFIVSSNNNIPKIKMTIEALSETFGKPIGHFNGKMRYAFPELSVLGKVHLEDMNVKAIGYRAKSVYETIQRIIGQNMDLQSPFQMDYRTAKAWLKQFYGVGDKVADCILLFAYGKQEAFPVDTWVKRVLRELYKVEGAHESFIDTHFVCYPGLSQQLLFYYMRQSKIK